MSLLRLDNVACTRGGRLLFEGLQLTLEPSGAAVVVGPNGAGKSSLLRIAAGLLAASAGKVERKAAALADEGLALDPKLTLGEALRFWAAMDRARAEAGMEAMNLMPLAKVAVRMLSTGQRKRAVLARVIATGAPLWLLDEPANGLDETGQERLTSVMAEHRRSGGAILAASHQPLGLEAAQTVALA